MTNIKIILGSNRPGRFAHQPGEWLRSIGEKIEGATFEVIDLEAVNLPLLDEPVSARMAPGKNEHTKAWAKVIGEADGFVFVAPEYNHSYTPVLKNALDYLFYEWMHKPAAFFGYGADAGGARATEHLRSVVGYLGMYDIHEHMVIPHYYLGKDEQGVYTFSEDQEKAAQQLLEQVAFWAEHMKPAREKLAKQ